MSTLEAGQPIPVMDTTSEEAIRAFFLGRLNELAAPRVFTDADLKFTRRPGEQPNFVIEVPSARGDHLHDVENAMRSVRRWTVEQADEDF